MASTMTSETLTRAPLTNPKLVRTIDALRELNIGQHIPRTRPLLPPFPQDSQTPSIQRIYDRIAADEVSKVPQLVVVGDQSSSKSSLLENLTSIPFPRGQGTITRYATQITSRREDVLRIDITIIPGPLTQGTDREKMQDYRKQLSSTEELRELFPSIIDEVSSMHASRITVYETSNHRILSF